MRLAKIKLTNKGENNMLRSMYAGISGMKNFQTKLDVIGNNIANVNTSGFKKGRVTFQDMMSQTTSGAQGPTATRGGVNPYQVGLGSQLGSIDNIHTQGFQQTTNRPLDLALEGDGMFVVAGNTGRPEGYETTIDGLEATLANLRAAETPDENAIETAEQNLANARTWEVSLDTSNVSYTRAGNFYLDTDGAIVSPDGLHLLGFQKTSDLDADAAFNYDNYSTIIIPEDAQSFSIQTDGIVNYVDSNGNPQVAGQVMLANFSNAAGLQKAGSNLYHASPNSGIPVYTIAETNGTGSMVAGSLEMSNVDLAEEFTEMIVAQRGFQANTRICLLYTSDAADEG